MNLQNGKGLEKGESKVLFYFRFLGPYLCQHKGRLFLTLLSVGVFSFVVLFLGDTIRSVVDAVLGEGSRKGFFVARDLHSLFIGVFALFISTFGRSYCVGWISERVTHDLRIKLFNHLIQLDQSFYDQTIPDSLCTCLTSDMTLVQTVTYQIFALGLRNFCLVVGALIMMCLTSLKLMMLGFLILPLLWGVMVFFGKRVRCLSQKTQNNIERMSSYFFEIFSNIKTVNAFNHDLLDRDHFSSQSFFVLNTALKRCMMRSFLTSVVVALVVILVIAMLILGYIDVVQGRLSKGELSSFLFYALVLATSSSGFSEMWADIEKACGALIRIHELFEVHSIFSTPPKRALSTPRGIVAFHHVFFSYPKNHEINVLDDVTFSMAPGEKLAIVGHSGSGKSTIFSLLLRFYDPQSGTIYLDGVDLRDVSTRDIRSRIALVSQEAPLFSMSIFDNIAYGHEKATDSDVFEAVERAHVDEFLHKLPRGLQTLVNSQTLSPGQRQRIAIARAIIKKPSFLLLDEASNSLDVQSEALITQSLKNFMSTCTSITIAHRLSTVLHSDRILVLQKGRVDMIGTHAELITNCSYYRRLVTLQFGMDRSPT